MNMEVDNLDWIWSYALFGITYSRSAFMSIPRFHPILFIFLPTIDTFDFIQRFISL